MSLNVFHSLLAIFEIVLEICRLFGHPVSIISPVGNSLKLPLGGRTRSLILELCDLLLELIDFFPKIDNHPSGDRRGHRAVVDEVEATFRVDACIAKLSNHFFLLISTCELVFLKILTKKS